MIWKKSDKRILSILICFKYAPSSFGVYSGNRELSVHLELFRIIYKRTRYAQMERMIAGKDRVMCFNLWHIF